MRFFKEFFTLMTLVFNSSFKKEDIEPVVVLKDFEYKAADDFSLLVVIGIHPSTDGVVFFNSTPENERMAQDIETVQSLAALFNRKVDSLPAEPGIYCVNGRTHVRNTEEWYHVIQSHARLSLQMASHPVIIDYEQRFQSKSNGRG